MFRVRTGVVRSSGISSIGVEGSAACWGEDRSTTGAGGSEVSLRDLLGVAVASSITYVSPASSSTMNGFGMVASDDSSSTCCGTWAMGPSSSLWREGWALGQATLFRNCSTEGMDPGGATTYKLWSKIICSWWMLQSIASKHWESLWAGIDGASEVDAGVGATNVEGSSAGLALALLAQMCRLFPSIKYIYDSINRETYVAGKKHLYTPSFTEKPFSLLFSCIS